MSRHFQLPEPTQSRKRGNKKLQLQALAKRLAEKMKRRKKA